MGWTPGTVKQNLKPSAGPGTLIRSLMDGGCIAPAPHGHGWVVSDPAFAAAMVLSLSQEEG